MLRRAGGGFGETDLLPVRKDDIEWAGADGGGDAADDEVQAKVEKCNHRARFAGDPRGDGSDGGDGAGVLGGDAAEFPGEKGEIDAEVGRVLTVPGGFVIRDLYM